MDLVFLLLPASLLLAGVAVTGFIWAARTGQLDDLETPAHRVLFDDGEECAESRNKEKTRGDDLS